jgi:starch synthase
MRLLHATSELFPYSKTGGLADMVAGLTGALAEQGYEITIATPLYRGIREQFPELQAPSTAFQIPLGKNIFTGRWWKLNAANGVTVMFLENDGFFERPGLYLRQGDGYWDNPERFMFLSKAVTDLAGDFDVVHVHDWQTAFVPMLLKLGSNNSAPPTVLTIHNLAYQGSCEGHRFEISNLDEKYFDREGPEFWGSLNFLKAGLHYADAITTVSPRYAKEILSAEFGEGMEGVLRSRGEALTGILNGVDYDVWRTVDNPHLPADYSANDLDGKNICKEALVNGLGLMDIQLPVFGVVSRLAEQKGIGLLLDTIENFLTQQKLQLVVLGDGDPQLINRLIQLQVKFPGAVAAKIKYDNRLAHQIEAGSDFFLMPSRFEPCGLNQMYSLRFGTIPVVHAVGGLDDTIRDFRTSTQTANGIKFSPFDKYAFQNAISDAIDIFEDSGKRTELMTTGMKDDFSWLKSSREYSNLYQNLTDKQKT